MPARISRSRKRKKKNGFAFMFIMFLVLAGLCFAVFIYPLLRQWLPSDEKKDLSEWFEVSGDEARIYLDTEIIQGSNAIVSDGEAYLPYDFVSQALNSRFYYSEDDTLLCYTLPTEVCDYTADSLIGSHEAFLVSDGMPYLSVSLVEQYTSLSDTAFTGPDEAAKRIFLYSGGYTVSCGRLSRRTALRTSADKKAPVLEELRKGDEVYITQKGASWSRVVSSSGLVGYIDTDHISGDAMPDLVFPDTYKEPAVPYVMADGKAVIGFQALYSAADPDELESLYDATGGTINVVIPQLLQIADSDGTLIDYTDSGYIARAHELGLKVWACVDNVSQEGGIYSFDSGAFFGDTEKRRGFISKLLELSLRYGYDGLNLDFEGLSQDAGESFVQFFRELSAGCHAYGLTLSIDNYVPYDYNSHYGLSEQGVFADYCIIMCYDEHTGSDIGPVASYSYTEYGIEKALEYVGAEHLAAALPFYTRVWRTNDGVISSEAMGMRRSLQYVSDNGIVLEWDEDAGAYYGETLIGSGKIQIWLEEQTSLGAKMQLVRDLGIGGAAFWRLGLETEDIWEILDPD